LILDLKSLALTALLKVTAISSIATATMVCSLPSL
jgi:hypothetical protein